MNQSTMKKNVLVLIGSMLLAFPGFGQSKTYLTSGGEMIFSFASITANGHNVSSTMRWAPVFNAQTMVNKDLNSNFGLFTGIALRNVGFIDDQYADPSSGNIYKKKFRSYNVGIPLGFKIGDLNKLFLYAGYEVELPFLYKEKTFEGGDKIDKITGWFSNRENLFQHGFLVGVQFPYGLNLKFKYYLSEFNNQSYTDARGNKPYAGLKANVFYFSLSSYLFKNLDLNKNSSHSKKSSITSL